MQKNKSQTKYYIQTFGCQMNYSDTERFETVLNALGFKKSKLLKNADIIIFNSCSVRQKAEDRILGLGNIIENYKAKNPKLIIILTGCMARRYVSIGNKYKGETWKNLLYKQMPWLDLIIETQDFHFIIKELKEIGFECNLAKPKYDKFFDIVPSYQSKFQAYLPISTGCNHFCSYCIVPYTRGREECRSYKSIFEEYQNLIKLGYKDIVLVGQTVNRWINPNYKNQIKINDINKNKYKFDEPADFLQLVQALDRVKGDYWLSFISSHPKYFTDELIKYFQKSDHLKPHIHLALQSGNNEVLNKMRRDYKYEDVLNIVTKFRKVIPDMAIATDIIVGFPGEDVKMFADTARVMSELNFDMAYINEYSKRSGTSAFKLRDDIVNSIKAKRKDVLNEILRITSKNQKLADVGKVIKCLATRFDKGKTLCKTEKNRDVEVQGKLSIGKFYYVEIFDCTDWSLKGKIV